MNPVSPKRGRPATTTPAQVLDKLLRAATDILGEQTIDADFSMAQIAQRAGMSKRTVYTAVQGKEMLIAHLISRNTLKAITVLDTPVPDAAGARDVLQRFLSLWATLALAPVAVGIYTMAVRERSRYPELGLMYYRSGTQHGQDQLTQWLAGMAAQGFLQCDDPALTADLLMAMITAEQRTLALGILRTADPARIARRIGAILALVFGTAAPH